VAAAIYGLCALTALFCACMLLGHYRRTKQRLLLWSGLCFAALTANNVILVVDRLVLPAADLSTWRLVTALAAMSLLLYGLVYERD
jgi:hypothetical protein